MQDHINLRYDNQVQVTTNPTYVPKRHAFKKMIRGQESIFSASKPASRPLTLGHASRAHLVDWFIMGLHIGRHHQLLYRV